MIALPNRLDSPEFQAGVAAAFLGSHAGPDVLFRLGRYMQFHLFSEPFVAAPGREVQKACE